MQNLELDSRRAYEYGASLETIVETLRSEGCDMPQSMRIVQALTGWDTRAAHQSVLYSNAWRRERLAYEALLEQEARQAYESGMPLETIMERLRTAGAIKIASIKIVRAITGWEIGRAKQTVDQSKAWGDRQAVDAALHEQLEQTWRLIQWAEREGLGDVLGRWAAKEREIGREDY